MSSNIENIQTAIQSVEKEIRELNGVQASLNDKRHLLTSLTGQNSLSPSDDLQERIARCLKDIEAGVAARDILVIKKASIAHLNDELTVARGNARRTQCEDLLAQFDRTKASYIEQSEALLVMFRRMHELSRQYVGLTGRTIMFEQDYRLELPALRKGDWPSPFSTGMEVRM